MILTIIVSSFVYWIQNFVDQMRGDLNLKKNFFPSCKVVYVFLCFSLLSCLRLATGNFPRFPNIKRLFIN